MKENYLAITLGKIDIGEMDRLYTFYTREAGMMRVRARGIRKPSARLAPHVEDFLISHITIAKNHGPGTLAGAITEESFLSVQQHLPSVLVMMNVRDFFVRIIHGSEADTKLFDLYRDFLRASNHYQSKKPQASILFLAQAFLMKVFDRLGYGFTTRHCPVCRQDISKDQRYFFSGHGVICAGCNTSQQHTMSLQTHTIVFLRLINTQSMENLEKVLVTPDVEREMQSVLLHTKKWVL